MTRYLERWVSPGSTEVRNFESNASRGKHRSPNKDHGQSHGIFDSVPERWIL
jgi:hypothetical protein